MVVGTAREPPLFGGLRGRAERQLLDHIAGDVERRIGPRDIAAIEVEDEEESPVPGDLRDRRSELDEEGTFELALDAGDLCLRVLNEPLNIDAELLDLSCAPDAGVVAESSDRIRRAR
jgi:hypothetical protein